MVFCEYYQYLDQLVVCFAEYDFTAFPVSEELPCLHLHVESFLNEWGGDQPLQGSRCVTISHNISFHFLQKGLPRVKQGRGA
jgi:hypothetical protein